MAGGRQNQGDREDEGAWKNAEHDLMLPGAAWRFIPPFPAISIEFPAIESAAFQARSGLDGTNPELLGPAIPIRVGDGE